MVCGEGSFIDAGVGNSDLMVFGSEVKRGEDSRAMEFIEELLNNMYMMCLVNGNFVELAIVKAKCQLPSFFIDKEDN